MELVLSLGVEPEQIMYALQRAILQCLIPYRSLLSARHRTFPLVRNHDDLILIPLVIPKRCIDDAC